MHMSHTMDHRIVLPWWRRRGATRLLGLIVALGFSTLWLAACGGGSSNKNPGTTKGSYTVKLSATSGGTNPVSNSTQVTLIVQ